MLTAVISIFLFFLFLFALFYFILVIYLSFFFGGRGAYHSYGGCWSGCDGAGGLVAAVITVFFTVAAPDTRRTDSV